LCTQENGNILPDNKVISSALGKKDSLKKYMKRAMPFAQMVKEKLIKVGDSAFNVKLDFDEKRVLEVNRTYLENTLDVSISFYFLRVVQQNTMIFTVFSWNILTLNTQTVVKHLKIYVTNVVQENRTLRSCRRTHR
jgi:hypothetical protein